MQMKPRNLIIAASGALLLSACQSRPPLETVDYVDLERFMGDWYVIANIPTFIERGAHNAVESYRLDEDGSIATTFTFRDGSFDGKLKTYRPRGFVVDTESNAVWAMQFIWPFKGDYRVIYLDGDYNTTVIGRNKLDYVWLMSRQPELLSEDYDRAVEAMRAAGYDITQLQRVPQQW
jgi:apolipoprotein D and lipocalin family protein